MTAQEAKPCIETFFFTPLGGIKERERMKNKKQKTQRILLGGQQSMKHWKLKRHVYIQGFKGSSSMGRFNTPG